MIDLKREIERELSLIDPPDLWDRIQADASNDGDAAVVDLTTARRRRRPSLWLAVAAVTVAASRSSARWRGSMTTRPSTPRRPPRSRWCPSRRLRPQRWQPTMARSPSRRRGRRAGRGPRVWIRRPDAEHRRQGRERRGDRRVPGQRQRGQGRLRGHPYTEGFASPYEDRVIILAGEVTAGPDFAVAGEDVLLALIIRADDSVSLYSNDIGAESCTELLESIPDDLIEDDNNFVDVEERRRHRDRLSSA